MPLKTWKVQPIHLTVFEILEKKGPLTNTNLFETLRIFYEEIGYNKFNKTLMNMEITKLISVSSLKRVCAS